MPIYEYECGACGHRFELIQKFSDEPADVCPKCGEHKLQKLMSSPAIQFKGSGFYINDYARKDTGGTESKPGEKSTSEKSDKSEKSEKSEKSDKSDKTTPATPASSPPSTPASSKSTDKS